MRQFSKTEQKHITLFERFYQEVWNERRTETIYEILAPEFVGHFENRDITGPDSIKKDYYDPVVRAFPDMHMEIVEITAKDDFVMARWRATGIQQAEIFGVPPSGEHVTITGMDWSRFADGMAVENWDNSSLSFVIRYLRKEIKTLKGILPVCSHCKSIRNDKGFWEQLEKYISDNTEATLSHGICPKCIAKEYPEVYEKMKKDGRI